MTYLWIFLTSRWNLEDVQAALNVAISVTCVAATFTSARWFWQSSVTQLAKKQAVPLSSLLTFTSIGETWDVLTLLKGRLFAWRYMNLAVQCFLVLFFCFSAIFAGPISRFSTRVRYVSREQKVNGFLASRSYQCEINNVRKWAEYTASLDNASFPLDQLLDYMPDPKTPWLYHESDWNSTYKASCVWVDKTPIDIVATGNYTSSNDPLYLYAEMPQLWDVMSDKFRDSYFSLTTYYSGTTNNTGKAVWDDAVVWQVATYQPDMVQDALDESTTVQRMSTHIAGIYLKDAPGYSADSDEFDFGFGKGKVKEAYYTKMECDFERHAPKNEYNYWEAFPDVPYTCDLAQELAHYFSADAMQPKVGGGTNDKLPTGEEYMRFYQAWMATKDTHYPHPVKRQLHVKTATVELSTIFLAVMALITFTIWVGTIRYFIFWISHSRVSGNVPETKVDWLLQSLRTTGHVDDEKDWKHAHYSLHHSVSQAEKGSGSSRTKAFGNVHWVESNYESEATYPMAPAQIQYYQQYSSGAGRYVELKPQVSSYPVNGFSQS